MIEHSGRTPISIIAPSIPIWGIYDQKPYSEELPVVEDLYLMPVIALALVQDEDGAAVEYVTHSGEGYVLDMEWGSRDFGVVGFTCDKDAPLDLWLEMATICRRMNRRHFNKGEGSV